MSSNSQYVRWNDEGVEPVVDNEEAKIDKVIALIHGVQDKNFAEHLHGLRGTHVKTQGIVKGTLKVLGGLPAHLAQGLFANGPHEHPVGVRFANEPHWLLDDRAPGPRGLGMKVCNVDGDFMDPAGQRTRTQDFTFNNAPILELRDVQTTGEIVDTRLRNWNDPDALDSELKQRKDADLQLAPKQLPNQHFLSYTFYSQSAYRYGENVCKYALFPTGKFQQALEQKSINDKSDPEQHSKWLQEYFASNDAEYDFRVQLLHDLDKQPVEDTSVQWGEDEFPFETVGKLVLPSGQDPMASARRTFWDDRMKLNVWYGLQAHRPLGSANRQRKRLYAASASKREQTNGAKLQEVSSIDQIP